MQSSSSSSSTPTIKFTDGVLDMTNQQFHRTKHNDSTLTLGYNFEHINISTCKINTFKSSIMKFLESIIPNPQQLDTLLHDLSKALTQDETNIRYVWPGHAFNAKNTLVNIIKLAFGKYCDIITLGNGYRCVDDITKTARLVIAGDIDRPTLSISNSNAILGMLIIPTPDCIYLYKPATAAFISVGFDIDVDTVAIPSRDQQSNMALGLFYLLKDYGCDDVRSITVVKNDALIGSSTNSNTSLNIKNSIGIFVNTRCIVNESRKILWSQLICRYELFCIETNMSLLKNRDVKTALAIIDVSIRTVDGYRWCYGIDI